MDKRVGKERERNGTEAGNEEKKRNDGDKQNPIMSHLRFPFASTA